MEQPLIDAHIHVWHFAKAHYDWLQNETSILNRNYDISELGALRMETGVTEGLLVQAANNPEDTRWMIAVAEKTPWITGVIGWLPLTDPDATSKALSDSYAANSYFKGVRHLIHNEPDPKWLLQDKVIESLRLLEAHQLPFDIVGVTEYHIETALELAALVPGLKMIFDHLNQPPIAVGEKFGPWGQLMAEAAAHHNFYVKISGLGTASKKENWHSEDVEPYIEFALKHFGSNRCILGSDWPVSLLAGSYVKTWEVYKQTLASLLDQESKDNVYYKNAVAFYNLRSNGARIQR